MKQLKCYTILGIFFVLILGTLSHFLYDWSGNHAIVGLFTPVNESVWEHMKLVFFPMLLYSLIMIFQCRRTYPCITSALCCGIVVGTLLVPALYYAYTFILGKNSFILDIGIFILSVLIAFGLSYRLTLCCIQGIYMFLPCFLVCILFTCFMLFTCHPPAAQIFENPAALPPVRITRKHFCMNGSPHCNLYTALC